MKRLFLFIFASIMLLGNVPAVQANSWSRTVVSSGQNGGHSITFVGGVPHLAYYKIIDSCTTRVMHSYKNGSSWSSEIVDTINKCGFFTGVISGSSRTDIEVDQNNRLHLVYDKQSQGNSDNKLFYASKPSGSSWSITDTFSGVQYHDIFFLNIEVHNDLNTPIIAFQDFNIGNESVDAVYLYKDGNNWNYQIVEQAPSYTEMGRFISLDIDGDNISHLAYYAGIEGSLTLKYATNIDSQWDRYTIEDDADLSGSEISLVVDYKNRPNIAYGLWETGCNSINLTTVNSSTNPANWSTETVTCSNDYFDSISLRFSPIDNAPIFAYALWNGTYAAPLFGFYSNGNYQTESVYNGGPGFGNRPLVEVNPSTNQYTILFSTAETHGSYGPLQFATRN